MATKDELSSVRSELKNEISEVRQLQRKTLRIQEATFTTVQSIEERLKETADHTERIERLEQHVFKTKR